MNEQASSLFVIIFPFFFGGLWLLITSILGHFSGWFELERQYPDRDEQPLLILRGASGNMGGGMGVSFSGVLKFSACPSGLRVGVWRIFGPFQRPFLVPWGEIHAEPKKTFWSSRVRLRFGGYGAGELTIAEHVWSRLSNQVSAGISDQAAPNEISSYTQAEIRRWLASAALMAAFFYFVPRFMSDGKSPPLAVCIIFPLVITGIPLAIRLMRSR